MGFSAKTKKKIVSQIFIFFVVIMPKLFNAMNFGIIPLALDTQTIIAFWAESNCGMK